MALRFLIVFTFLFAFTIVCLECKSARKKRSIDEYELDLLLERNGYVGSSKRSKRTLKESCFTDDCAKAKAKARAKREALMDDLGLLAPKKQMGSGKQKPLQIPEGQVHPIIPKLAELTQKVADLHKLKNAMAAKPVPRESPVAHVNGPTPIAAAPKNIRDSNIIHATPKPQGDVAHGPVHADNGAIPAGHGPVHADHGSVPADQRISLKTGIPAPVNPGSHRGGKYPSIEKLVSHSKPVDDTKTVPDSSAIKTKVGEWNTDEDEDEEKYRSASSAFNLYVSRLFLPEEMEPRDFDYKRPLRDSDFDDEDDEPLPPGERELTAADFEDHVVSNGFATRDPFIKLDSTTGLKRAAMSLLFVVVALPTALLVLIHFCGKKSKRKKKTDEETFMESLINQPLLKTAPPKVVHGYQFHGDNNQSYQNNTTYPFNTSKQTPSVAVFVPPQI